MDFLTVLLLAVALGTDAFSLCLGLGLAGIGMRWGVMMVFTVLAYHVAMPLAGWLAGELAGKFLGRTAALAGAALLIFLGAATLKEALRGGNGSEKVLSLARGPGMLLLGAGVSVDALGAGFTLGARQTGLLAAASMIGAVAGVMTAAGLLLGRYLGERAGSRARLAGGLLLLAVGIKLLVAG